MKQLGFRTCVLLIIVAFLSLPVSQPLILADELSRPIENPLLDREHKPAAMQSTGSDVAGGGLAGAGASKNLDPVIVRNVIIGLVFAGLLVASALSETEQ